jgi:isopenicillin N synthase-like dioxygenase
LVAQSYAFFDLPPGEKLAVRRPRPEQNRGYIAPGEERLARLRGDETLPDLKELYTIGPFDLPDTPYFTGPAAYPSFAPNLWPARPKGLRPALEAYWHELDRVARLLCRISADALYWPPEFFDDKTDRHISQLRIMHFAFPKFDRPRTLPILSSLRKQGPTSQLPMRWPGGSRLSPGRHFN